ncbi:MAG: hypothetical protein KDE53_02240 [Caldilineaceae bacterium]|nr:hypothetical protein [Caldilineaceae bacterium]MCB0187925.1 hypothetical protein [Caldilineaceae bacterium]HRW04057.1 hypothetical protein [Caldilineaceae bacterium]
MIARFLWGYLCIAGTSSLLVYCACMAAARADRIMKNAHYDTLLHRQQADQNTQMHYYPYASSLSRITCKSASSMGRASQFAQLNDL